MSCENNARPRRPRVDWSLRPTWVIRSSGVKREVLESEFTEADRMAQLKAKTNKAEREKQERFAELDKKLFKQTI